MQPRCTDHSYGPHNSNHTNSTRDLNHTYSAARFNKHCDYNARFNYPFVHADDRQEHLLL